MHAGIGVGIRGVVVGGRGAELGIPASSKLHLAVLAKVGSRSIRKRFGEIARRGASTYAPPAAAISPIALRWDELGARVETTDTAEP